jgi:polyphosphate kinase
MKQINLDSPKLYISRELSWLQFNKRVLQQALRSDFPLAERLRFLAIVSSNLDEFFMIRVAGLMNQKSAGIRKKDISGLTPAQHLSKISEEAHKIVAAQNEAVNAALEEAAGHDVHLLRQSRWNAEEQSYLKRYFKNELMPVLTPLAMNHLNPPPTLPGRQIYVAINFIPIKGQKNQKQVIVIPVPQSLPRLVRITGAGGVHLALLEDIIADNAELLCPAGHLTNITCFRITRDADISIQEDEASDLLESIEKAVVERRRRSPVRLEIYHDADSFQKKWLLTSLGLSTEDLYEITSVMDATMLYNLAVTGPLANLKFPDWPPQKPIDLLDSEDLWQTIRERDVMLFHPYESFEPVVELIRSAAEDPNVIAIKQTLYRTSGDSPIIKSLEQAAQNGKEVTVLVELKARFDEARNVNWARRLEDAGCHVIYGIAKLKTHAKALLIIRREETRIRRYVHLATGNYNDKTAKLYSDIGLFTTDSAIASDVTAFFNLLTGYSETVGWQELSIAPTDMKQKFLDLIDREVQTSTANRPGQIMAKVNSLEDRTICKALYKAGQAGVKIMLNVRGICCLRPGLKGISDNIEVRSIVDRFLEHARIFYFRNGGHDEVYLSSADWMRRNLDRRLELLFPVKDESLKKRLVDILNIYFADNTHAYILQGDGNYSPSEAKGPNIRAQESLYREVSGTIENRSKTALRFRPMKQPG